MLYTEGDLDYFKEFEDQSSSTQINLLNVACVKFNKQLLTDSDLTSSSSEPCEKTLYSEKICSIQIIMSNTVSRTDMPFYT